MQKLLISLTCIASLQLTACASTDEPEAATRSSILESIPIVYRPDIQQGNVLDQDAVNQLKPGMAKRQVRFLMGTPMLVDVFHQDRWDYVYTKTEGWGEPEEKRVTIFFDNDRLVSIEGDLRPDPDAPAIPVKKDTVVSVPDYVDPDRGIIEKAADSVASLWSDEAKPPVTPDAPAATTDKP